MSFMYRAAHHAAKLSFSGLLIALSWPAMAYNDGAGKEWRQPVTLLGVARLTREQISAVCPTDGATACQGVLAGLDMKEWVWASQPQMRALFGRYAPALLDPTVSFASGASAQFMTDFVPTFDQLVGGCGSYSGCSRVTLVTGISADVELPGGVPTKVIGEGSGGGFFIAAQANHNPAGLWMWRPTGHGTYHVHAYDDVGRLNAPGAGVVNPNVLSNDWVGGVRATPANATLTQLASDLAGIYLDTATGAVHAAAGVAPGTWNLIYRICNAAAPSYCDDAKVAVVVPTFAISAANDSGTISYGSGGTAITSVLANDRLGAVVPTAALVSITQVSTTHAGVSLDPNSGAVRVAPGTPHGTHQIVYRICDRALSTHCAQATATVTPMLIMAYPDSGRGSSKVANTPIASVLANDWYGSARPTSSTVVLSTVGTWPSGIALNLSTGAVNILHKISSSTYTMRYRICERASPGNCSEANISLYTSGGL